MAAHRPELYTIDAVLAWYEKQKPSMYRIFAGMVPDKQFCRYQYLDPTNKDQGYEELRGALESIKEDPRNTNPYVIQSIEGITMVPQKGTKGPKEQIDAINIGFKLNDENYSAEPKKIGSTGVQVITPGESPYIEKMLLIMERNNEALLARMEALENKILLDPDDDLEEYDEPEGKDLLMGAIGGILKKPEVQNAAASLIAGLAGKYFSDDKKQGNDEW